jgi:hypothetical protein
MNCRQVYDWYYANGGPASGLNGKPIEFKVPAHGPKTIAY